MAELDQARSRQPLCQRRLTGQNDLKQFLVRRFKVREQSHGLKHCVGEILRLVNKNYYSPSYFRLAKQEFVQFRVHPYNVFALVLDAQVIQQVANQLSGVTLRLKQERAVDVALPSLQELEQQRGLAHPRLRNEG